MGQKAELPTWLKQRLPWANAASGIWPMSSFLMKRNLSRYVFAHRLPEGQSKQLCALIQGALLSLGELQKPIALSLEDLSSHDREFLVEHFLYPEGIPISSPYQAVVLDETARFLAIINVQDHLQLHMLQSTGEWEKGWKDFMQMEATLSRALNFAFNARFGYLTANPVEAGTGLSMTAFLHLPALNQFQQLKTILAQQKETDLTALSLEGSTDEFIGDVVVLKNAYSLGMSEEAILHGLQNGANRCAAAELALRNELRTSPSPKLRDLVGRAYGLLSHSCQLQTKETLNALSLLILGADLGWVTGVSIEKIGEAFFNCRRGHLASRSSDPDEVSRKRSETMHQALAGMRFL